MSKSSRSHRGNSNVAQNRYTEESDRRRPGHCCGHLCRSPSERRARLADFRPGDQSYRYDGKYGKFTGDAVYASQQPDGGNRLIWSLQLSPYVRGLIVGNTMACGAYVDGKSGYSDNHSAIPADYRWHSMVPNLELDRQYKLVMSCAFQATNGHVVSPGHADFQMVFTLHSS
ncbi:hypothetical protein AB0H00_08555 [Nocardia sp. NPDC023852]|uniref:hypothetical protein n=1 Tax=Nocardia sp. NPDC023852 TaxID=3154697 RepID=UPI0034017206